MDRPNKCVIVTFSLFFARALKVGMQSAGSKEQELVLVEHAFEYSSKDGRIISIKPNERYILLKRTNEHWWHVCLDKNATPFYIPAKYVKALPLTATRFNGFQPYKDSLEDVQVAVPSNEYSYKFLPPNPQVSANFPLPSSDIQPTITGNATTSRDVESASKAQSPKVPCINTSNTLPKVCMPKLAATNTLPSAMVPRVTSNNVQPKVVVPQIHVNDVLTKVPQIHSSYTLPPTNAQHVSAPQPRSSTQSLPSDLPLVCGASGLDSIHTYPKEQPEDICTHAPMRTFHNSKKVVDPTKRISFLCLTDVQPNILTTPPSGNLNPEPFTPPHQQQLHIINNSSGLCGPHQVVTEPSVTTGSNRDSPSAQPIKEEEDIGPLYENLKPLQKESLRERASSLQHSSTSTLDDWETHTDTDSGQLFYYNSVTGVTTWDSPFDQPEDQGLSPTSLNSLSPLAEDSQWEKHFDEATSQYYFYNPVTGETSWDPPEEEMSFQEFSPMVPSYISVDRRPPTPEADYPDYPPEEVESYPDADYHHDPPGLYEQIPLDKSPVDPNSGWFCQVNKEGKKCYSNNYNSETWVQSEDRSGKTYFYNPDGCLSQWSLPRVGPPRVHTPNDDDVFTKLQHNYPTFSPLKHTEDFGQRLKRAVSEDLLDINHHHHQTKSLEKAGVLHKAKISGNGKKLRKSWSSSWTVLEGGILTFFKDGKNLSSNSARQSQLSTPEYTVRLEGATLRWATKDKSSKKHVLELKTREGSEFLIHHDSETITADWHESIKNSIAKSIRLSADHTPEDEPELFQEFGSTEKLGTKDEKKNSSMGSGSNSDSDHKVRAKLKKFLQRRPTLQSLRDKGYIKEQVFGCPLQQLCEREKQNVPEFVRKAIQAVEKRGLDIDGLYRVSGNLATIQKLRHKVDQESINLEDGRWEDVHVITGALKLFFRELPEPLFPFSHFDIFIETIKLNDPAMKKKQFKELIQSLPSPNRDTMQFLFRHLCNVIEYRESNRMSIQSIAIVFGPTLLRPSIEGANIAMFMVFQNQIVEHVLTQYKYIFNTS
ncbi:rho GTPase-activating protein 27 isoform X2 [Xenopus laevis]|uniref:Rho GTPase-activating protein 27 isoform X2 n=1 Tax=Xenopus laevis TaxID=8355 RepID=A0A8J0TKJ5_XENLA|nr:rho GTPase-activating protein 27 isoform X2 [Xenopus laevis]